MTLRDEDVLTDAMLEDHIEKLRRRDCAVSPIPMMNCSMRTGRIPDFSNFILPDCALQNIAAFQEQASSVGGRQKKSLKGRGRASRLKERVRRGIEKNMVTPGSTLDLTDSTSGTGSEDCFSTSSPSVGVRRESQPDISPRDRVTEQGQFDDVLSQEAVAHPDSAETYNIPPQGRVREEDQFAHTDLAEPYNIPPRDRGREDQFDDVLSKKTFNIPPQGREREHDQFDDFLMEDAVPCTDSAETFTIPPHSRIREQNQTDYVLPNSAVAPTDPPETYNSCPRDRVGEQGEFDDDLSQDTVAYTDPPETYNIGPVRGQGHFDDVLSQDNVAHTDSDEPYNIPPRGRGREQDQFEDDLPLGAVAQEDSAEVLGESSKKNKLALAELYEEYKSKLSNELPADPNFVGKFVSVCLDNKYYCTFITPQCLNTRSNNYTTSEDGSEINKPADIKFVGRFFCSDELPVGNEVNKNYDRYLTEMQPPPQSPQGSYATSNNNTTSEDGSDQVEEHAAVDQDKCMKQKSKKKKIVKLDMAEPYEEPSSELLNEPPAYAKYIGRFVSKVVDELPVGSEVDKNYDRYLTEMQPPPQSPQGSYTTSNNNTTSEDGSDQVEEHAAVDQDKYIKQKSKKKKFVKLDLAEPYEEYKSELLYGIPAGAEFSGRFGFMCSDQLPTVPFGEYIPDVEQKKPKTQSVVDFPFLPKEAKTSSNNVSFMNKPAPIKESIKSIATFVTDMKRVAERVEENGEEEEEVKEESKGVVVVLENVPSTINKATIKDLVQDYGQVTHIRTEKVGDGYSAFVRMEDADTAEWMAGILDGSDALLTGGEGTPLSVYVQYS